MGEGNGQSRGLHIEVVEVSVAQAKKWMGQNRVNRPFRDWLAYRYAADMEASEWRETGEPIKFSRDGHLMDGQHRLGAIVLYGRSVRLAVAYDLDPAAFDVLDTGLKRSGGDQLAASGEKNANALAAALTWLIALERSGTFLQAGTRTNREIRQALQKHPGIRESATKLLGMRPGRVLRPSLAVALHYLMAERDEAAADAFWAAVIEGVALERSDPVWLLRQRLLADQTAKARLRPVEVAALCVKAWNARREGRPLRQLRWGTGGTEQNREAFPLPV